jgi:hypothetical protein
MGTGGWRLDKRDGALRVEIDAVLPEDEADAVELAIEEEMEHDGVEVIHATGAFLRDPRPGTKRLLRRLGALAQRLGTRFGVGPI